MCLTWPASAMLSSLLGIPNDVNKTFGNNDVVLFNTDDNVSAYTCVSDDHTSSKERSHR
jgi:hypothetical protein